MNTLRQTLKSQEASLKKEYQEWQGRQLKLDLTRGKPCAEQLALSEGLKASGINNFQASGGVDTRNYGGLEGLQEARELLGSMTGLSKEDVLVLGNSSLNLMADYLIFCKFFGPQSDFRPWQESEVTKILCPVPGYDRHFTICESLNMEMVPVPLLDDGPDMDIVEKLVSSDAAIKGMWNVPVYGNPTGAVYSARTIQRLASMKTAAPDFRLLWDNAYAVHHLTQTEYAVPEILQACRAAGQESRAIVFGSTSKITFAGGGLAYIGMGSANRAAFTKFLSFRTIGPDKVTQLEHVRFLKDRDGILAHMRRHAEIIRPKFDLVLRVLEKDLGGLQIADWTQPKGGYFISFNSLPGLATRIVELAKGAGVALTPAGSTYPYKKDPENRNIRLSPTFPPLAELEAAMSVFTLCVKLATLES